MKRTSFFIITVLVCAITGVTGLSRAAAQTNAKSTPAYEVLVVRRAAVKAELATLKETRTAQHPDVMRVADELSVLDLEIAKVLSIDVSQLSKLTSVYGHLVLKKVTLEVEEQELRKQYTAEHPALRQKQQELEAVEQEIVSLLR